MADQSPKRSLKLAGRPSDNGSSSVTNGTAGKPMVACRAVALAQIVRDHARQSAGPRCRCRLSGGRVTRPRIPSAIAIGNNTVATWKAQSAQGSQSDRRPGGGRRLNQMRDTGVKSCRVNRGVAVYGNAKSSSISIVSSQGRGRIFIFNDRVMQMRSGAAGTSASDVADISGPDALAGLRHRAAFLHMSIEPASFLTMTVLPKLSLKPE